MILPGKHSESFQRKLKIAIDFHEGTAYNKIKHMNKTGRAVRPVPFQAVEKVASATFSKELHEIFTSISDEIVGKNFMRSVIFEAHVPENDGFSFDSVICG